MANVNVPSVIKNKLDSNTERLSSLKALLDSVDKDPNALEKIKSKYKIYSNICDLSIRRTEKMLNRYLTFNARQKRILLREISRIEKIKVLLNDIQSGLVPVTKMRGLSNSVTTKLKENEKNLKYIIENLNASEKDPAKLGLIVEKSDTYINTCKVTLRDTKELPTGFTTTVRDKEALVYEGEDIEDLIADISAQAKKGLSSDDSIDATTEDPLSPRQSNQ